MVGQDSYIPQRGDVVRILQNPQVWYEQSGLRPAVVISPAAYNSKVGLALFCPVSSQIKGYPYEVLIPDGLALGGAILADQVKILDWKSRRAEFVCSLPAATINEIMGKVQTLIL
jgi:mRNA interferase MazF